MTFAVSRRATANWSPSIGVRYATRLGRLVGLWWWGAVLLALGLLAILVVALGREGSIGTLVVAIAIAAAGYVCWAIPLGRIDRLGRELQHELAGAGIATDRRAPLHNQRLYRAWLARNRLTDATVLRVVGVPEV